MLTRFHTGLGKETFYKEVFGCGAFIAAMLLTLLANAAFGVTGLSPSGPSQQAVSSASPLPSHFAGEQP